MASWKPWPIQPAEGVQREPGLRPDGSARPAHVFYGLALARRPFQPRDHGAAVLIRCYEDGTVTAAPGIWWRTKQ